MSTDDLASLSGLEEKHARALAKQPLQITTFRELASADSDAIYRAMHRFQPRPGREDIASWQDQARRKLRAPVMDSSDWQPVASFAVVFSQRQVDGDWERRLEAERTEVEPEMPPFVRPSWDCSPVCDWMHGHLPADHAEPEAGEAGVTPAVQPAAGAPPGHAERAELRIDSAEITDATHELSLIAAGQPTGTPPEELTPPVRLNLTVSGARSGQQVQAAAWFLRRAEPGWSPQEPVTVSPSGHAEFDLASVPAGEHQIRLLAWATDADATLAGATLPKLTFGQVVP